MFNKSKYIKVSENENGEVTATEKAIEEATEKEEKKMGFFKQHKGLIIGGLTALAAGAVGFVIGSSKGSDGDDDLDESYLEDFDDADDGEATSEEN